MVRQPIHARLVPEACTAFHQVDELGPVASTAPLWSLSPNDAEPGVLPILSELFRAAEPVELNVLGAHLAEKARGFDPRIYIRRALSSLLRHLPTVELVDHAGKLMVRLRLPSN